MKKIFKNYIIHKTTIETTKRISSNEILSENTDKDKVLEEFLIGKYRKPNDGNDNFSISETGCKISGNYGSTVKTGELLSIEEDYEVIEVK